ncbi:MAG: hypothetical protein KJ600_01075 [Nanoarchaeota archaeon]|nr:hypothetical protein [Nanoarchaeota archaeon]
MRIVPETINRIRLSDKELVLLGKILGKVDKDKLDANEKKFWEIILGRVGGRLKLKKKGVR